MAPAVSNDAILEQLRSGTALLEITSSPVPSVLKPNSNANPLQLSENNSGSRFFARIGPPSLRGAASSSIKKAEHYAVQKVTGDGRCMFRALVKGMAMNKGITLTSHRERSDAGELRMAVKEIICEDDKERRQYHEAVIAITIDEPLKQYCERIGLSNFWGGESELLVLSKLCHQPIIVYIPAHEHKGAMLGSGFIPIAEYGSEYRTASRKREPRKVVRLLYNGRNHYDLLV